MNKTLRFSWVLPAILASPLSAEPPTIYHRPFGCAVADRFPLLEARFAPAADVAMARVLFQAEGAQWYSVRMKPEGAVFAAILPKPRKSLKSFRYYIEVTDKALGTNHTVQYVIAVVDSPSACRGKLLAGPLASASVLLQGPPGASAPPAGFASSGVTTVAESGSAEVATRTVEATANTGSASGVGATATTSPAGAAVAVGETDSPGKAAAAGAAPVQPARPVVRAGGGGLGTAALVLGGLGAAGGAVAVAAARRGNDSPMSNPGDSSPSTAPTQAPTGQPSAWQLAFAPSLDITLCAGGPTVISSERVTPDATGSFTTFWTAILRVTGQALPITFQATLACTSGTISGAISATGSVSGYTGTFQFGTQRGQVTITRAP